MTIQKFVGMTVREVVRMAKKADIRCVVSESDEAVYLGHVVELEFDPETGVIISSTWI